MATTLEEVKANLPKDASTLGWDDSKIQPLVDAGISLPRIMMDFWNGRAADTHKLVSVSESGSTRSLSDIYNNAVEMLKYWTQRASSEEQNTDADPRFR